tara:strand:- start:25174 stop:25620 length:447 start_codon:yes stop_codon:yes gene_type:complete
MSCLVSSKTSQYIGLMLPPPRPSLQIESAPCDTPKVRQPVQDILNRCFCKNDIYTIIKARQNKADLLQKEVTAYNLKLQLGVIPRTSVNEKRLDSLCISHVQALFDLTDSTCARDYFVKHIEPTHQHRQQKKHHHQQPHKRQYRKRQK